MKTVSYVLVLIFLLEQSGFAREGRLVWKGKSPIENVPSDLKLPYSLAEVKGDIDPAAENTVINIQDAHSSLSAQYSISSILDDLVTEYDLSLIALEGAEGEIDTTIFDAIPYKAARDVTAEALMRRGRMGAGEFFAITNDVSNVVLYGIDDDELYRSNLEAFKNIASQRKVLLDLTDRLLAKLQHIAKRQLSDELLDFEELCREHRSGNMSFTEYWACIRGYTDQFDPGSSEYTDLEAILEVSRLEENIDFERANRQRARLLDDLGSVLSREELEMLVFKTVRFKEGKISPPEFHTFLIHVARLKGLDLDDAQDLLEYSRYIRLYHGIDLVNLFFELDSVEETIRAGLYSSDEDRRLNELIRYIGSLKKLFSVELSAIECRKLESLKRVFSVDVCKSIISSAGQKFGLVDCDGLNIESIIGSVDEALDFYHLARERDRAMIGNTVKRMRREGKRVAALITGGYHSEGMAELVKDKRVSYLIVTPKFEVGKERPYVAVLTDTGDKYRELIDAGEYQLSVEPYCSRIDENEIVEIALNWLVVAAMDGREWRTEYAEWIENCSSIYRSAAEGERSGKRVIDPDTISEALGMDVPEGQGGLEIYRMSRYSALVAMEKNGKRSYFVYQRDPESDEITSNAISGEDAERSISTLLERQRTGDAVRRIKKLYSDAGNERAKIEKALKVSWWKEEIFYFWMPFAVIETLLYSFFPEQLWLGGALMLLPRFLFFSRHFDGSGDILSFKEKLRRRTVSQIVAMSGILIASVPSIFSGWSLTTVLLLSGPAMMVTHLFWNVIAVIAGLEPAVIVDGDLRYYQVKYDSGKLDSLLKLKGLPVRSNIKDARVAMTSEAFSGLDISDEMDVDHRLGRYLDLVVRGALAIAKKQGLPLYMGENGGYSSAQRIRSYLNAALSRIPEGNKTVLLKRFEEIASRPEGGLKLVMGNAGALSRMDPDSGTVYLDAGIFKCMESPEAVELLIATAIGHHFLGRAIGALDDMGGTRTELELKTRDAALTNLIFKFAKQNFGIDLTDASRDIRDVFKAVRSYDELPYTSFLQAKKAIVKYGVNKGVGGRYMPLAVLGEGGMGIVFLALDKTTGEEVAVKIAKLPDDPDKASVFERRFLREIRLTREIDSEEVVRVLDDGVIGEGEDRMFYYVMPFYRWPTLKDILKDRTLSISKALEITVVVLEALVAIHAKGLVHRDLKPENIMISEDMKKVVIMDLGLIKDTDSSEQSMELTMSMAIMGSPKYMSPEQASGDTKEADERSDLFSVGVILYEMLTGEVPFQGSSTFNLIRAICDADHVPITEKRKDADFALDGILDIALAKARGDRYQSALEMRSDIIDWLESHSASQEVTATLDLIKKREGKYPASGPSSKRKSPEKRARKARGRKGRVRVDEPRSRSKQGRSLPVGKILSIGGLAGIAVAGITSFLLMNGGDEQSVGPDSGNKGTDISGEEDTSDDGAKSPVSAGDVYGALRIEPGAEPINCGSPDILDDFWNGGGSISFWIKHPGSMKGDLLGKGADSDDEAGWKVNCFKKRLGLGLNGGGDINFRTSYSIPISEDGKSGQWRHVVITYHGRESKEKPVFYVDGEEFPNVYKAGKENPRGYHDDAADLVIGRDVEFSEGAGKILLLDEILLYGKQISGRQVKRLFDSGRGAYGWNNDPELKAAWRFGEASGDRVIDHSGNGNDGEIKSIKMKRVQDRELKPTGTGGSWSRNDVYKKWIAWLETPFSLILGGLAANRAIETGINGITLTPYAGFLLGGILCAHIFLLPHIFANKSAMRDQQVLKLTLFTGLVGAVSSYMGPFSGHAVFFTAVLTLGHFLLNMDKEESALSADKDEVSREKAERAFSGEAAEDHTIEGELSVTMGIPRDILKRANRDSLDGIVDMPGVHVVPLDRSSPEEMRRELSAAAEKNGSIVSGIFDINDADLKGEKTSRALAGFTGELMREAFMLANPEMRGLNEDTISRINNIQKIVSDISAGWYLDDIVSMRISSESLYRERIWRTYNKYCDSAVTSYSTDPVISFGLRDIPPNYLVHYADGADLIAEGGSRIVPVGAEISRRRGEMGGISAEEDPLLDLCVVMAPEGVETPEEIANFKAKVMELWMLEGVIPGSNLIVLLRKEQMTASVVHGIVMGHLGVNEMDYTGHSGLRTLSGHIIYDAEAEKKGMVQLSVASGAVSTIYSYQVLLSLILKGQFLRNSQVPGLTYSDRGNLFIFFPDADPVDLEKEVKAYRRYLRDVLMMA